MVLAAESTSMPKRRMTWSFALMTSIRRCTSCPVTAPPVVVDAKLAPPTRGPQLAALGGNSQTWRAGVLSALMEACGPASGRMVAARGFTPRWTGAGQEVNLLHES